MYLVCPRPLRGYFPQGSKSKPVSPRATTVVGNTATLQGARSQESLALTFCFGSYTQQDLLPRIFCLLSVPSRLDHTSHLGSFPKPSGRIRPLLGAPTATERPSAPCTALAHLLAGLLPNDGSMKTDTISTPIVHSPMHSLSPLNAHYLLSTGAVRN